MLTFVRYRYFLVRFFLLFWTVSFLNANVVQQDFDCVITPSNVADLGSNARGVIKHIAVDRNDYVKKGMVIAVLDDEVEQAMVVLVRQQALDVSEVVLQKVNFTYAKREEEHAKDAYHDKAFSLHDFDKAKVTTQLAEIKLLQAKERQIHAENKLRQVQAQLSHRTIRAPFAGVIMERFKTIGEYIDDDPVVRLAQLDPLYVELIVPVSQKENISVGMKAKVCTHKNKGQGWGVTVSQVDEVIDAASGTFGVRLLLPNSDYKIPAGLRCDLKFIDHTKGVTSSHD